MAKELIWFLLVNPAAGGGMAIKKLPKIENALKNEGIKYLIAKTHHAGEANIIIQEAIIEGYRNFLIAGGDGTLNEVVNGIMSQTSAVPEEITIAQLPVGTGNDWRRTWNLPKTINECIALLKHGKRVLHDIGEINYTESLESKILWFINIAGIGFDAKVAYAANIQKEKGNSGLHVYLSELIKSLISFKEPEFAVSTDSKTLTFEGFTVLAGICRYAGNKMKLVPDADPQDRLLSVVLVKKLTKLKIIRNLPKLFSGKFIQLSEVSNFHCKEIIIKSNPPFFMQVDGESKGKSPVKIKVAEHQISVIVP